MNFLTLDTLTMSSNEIAELTDKDHKHVLTDIRNMLNELGFYSAEFSAQYKDSTGRNLPCFNLPKRETLILVSGYSIELRARIIDRWQELENENPKSPAEILLYSAQRLVEQERRMAAMDKKLNIEHARANRLENNIKRTLTNVEHMTVIAYANLNGISTESYHSASVGKKAKN